ncbi:HAD family hydrolase [Pukyongiella litopenaei]|uniref:HAD family phosphatase n=1 Tax=Pukyongiella litopenaei TaxID=2605946 RepID=A0A2S0MN03_9RHOB|nr:HAD family phosphatase [Pukyongiella litopenaei]AVO37260.1 HAD family phosphatase [Pukyongiella litopenaei]
MRPQAVVFDIGRVLIDWNPTGFYDREIGETARRALFAEVDLEAMNESVDMGRPFAASVEALARAHPRWAREILLWRDRWLDMASPAIPHTVRLKQALRDRGVPVFALSNFGVETFDIATAAYPFLLDFDRIWVSGHHGMMKPDPEFYAALEQGCGHDPAALLFADDRPENIVIAARRGWQVHLFDGPQGFAERLVADGLLNEEDAR